MKYFLRKELVNQSRIAFVRITGRRNTVNLETRMIDRGRVRNLHPVELTNRPPGTSNLKYRLRG